MQRLWNSCIQRIKTYRVFLPYILLLGCIVLPYVVHWGKFLAGNDTSFFEFSAFYNLKRSLYYWRDLNGVGGESFQGASTLLYQALVGCLEQVFGSVGTQILTKVVFYSAGFWGVYLLIREYAKTQTKKFNQFTASLIAYFYCINLIGFDLIRTWLYLYYIFFLLTPLLGYFFIKTVSDTKKWQYAAFLGCTLLNQIVFSNASYPAIQYLFLFCISIVFFKRAHMKRVIGVLIFFSVLNAPFFFETILAIQYQRANLFQNAVNNQLISDAPTVQQKFYSIFNILSFVSGRLLEGTRWTVDGSKQVFQSAAFYANAFVRLILLVPTVLIARQLSRKGLNKVQIFTGVVFLTSTVLVSMFGFGPLTNIFSKVFDAFPLLWIFRNSLKFSLIMLVFASLLLFEALDKRVFKIGFLMYLAAASLFALKGQFADVYSFTSIPAPYERLSSDIASLSIDTGDRMMAFPAYGNLWLVYTFGYLGFHPLVSFQNQIPSFTTNAYASGFASNAIYNELATLSEGSTSLFDKYGIKYVLLNHDLDYDAYRIDPKKYDQDKQFLDSHFEKTVENENFSLYQVSQQKNEIISGSNLVYRKVNPTEYQVTLMNVTSSREIVLNQAFSQGWRIYFEKPASSGLASIKRTFLDRFFQLDDIWWTHTLVHEYANGWLIDSSDQNLNQQTDGIEINSNGTKTVHLTIFFFPQVYYYLGVSIALVGLSAAIWILLIRSRYASQI